MSRPVSSRRCPLARLEKVWRESDLPDDLKALGVSLARQVRRQTPEATGILRMVQSLALQVWMKVQTNGADLMTLNRALSELNRSLRLLGIRPQGPGLRREQVFSVPRSPRRRQRPADIFSKNDTGAPAPGRSASQ